MPSGASRPDLERLHGLRLRLGLVIVAEEVQDAVHNKVRGMVRQGLAFAFLASRHRLEGERDVAERMAQRYARCSDRAGKDSTLVALSLPRHAVQLANAASSARRTLISEVRPPASGSWHGEGAASGRGCASLRIAERRPACPT